MSKWSSAVPTGHLKLDLAGGIDDEEWTARFRAGYGITNWLSAGAEAYAEHQWNHDTRYGALVGLTATF